MNLIQKLFAFRYINIEHMETQIGIQVNTIPIKISAKLVVDIDEIFLKFIWKCKGSRRDKIILKKLEEMTLPNLRLIFLAAV